MAGWLTDGVSPYVGALPFAGTFSLDTNAPAGAQPQTTAIPLIALAGALATLLTNTATSTAAAATLNTDAGLITTEALTTAAGASYTFTLTDSLILAGPPPVNVSMSFGTNTTGAITLVSVTNAAGSSVFVFNNSGTAAFNGTMKIAFSLS